MKFSDIVREVIFGVLAAMPWTVLGGFLYSIVAVVDLELGLTLVLAYSTFGALLGFGFAVIGRRIPIRSMIRRAMVFYLLIWLLLLAITESMGLGTSFVVIPTAYILTVTESFAEVIDVTAFVLGGAFLGFLEREWLRGAIPYA